VKLVAIAGGIVVLLLAAAAAFFLGKPAASSCNYPAPVNTALPPILKSVGGFDQAHDPGDVSDLEAGAVSAATAVNANLIGVMAQPPVQETPLHPGPAAAVVPLIRRTPAGSRVVALVAYLSDCTGRLYYDRIDNLDGTPVSAYPTVPQAAAASQLGGQTPQLQFSSDPFAPLWVAGGRQIPAT
jgi:hypothetical protein